jgi:hypothetical protein
VPRRAAGRAPYPPPRRPAAHSPPPPKRPGLAPLARAPVSRGPAPAPSPGARAVGLQRGPGPSSRETFWQAAEQYQAPSQREQVLRPGPALPQRAQARDVGAAGQSSAAPAPARSSCGGLGLLDARAGVPRSPRGSWGGTPRARAGGGTRPGPRCRPYGLLNRGPPQPRSPRQAPAAGSQPPRRRRRWRRRRRLPRPAPRPRPRPAALRSSGCGRRSSGSSTPAGGPSRSRSPAGRCT